MESLFSAAWPLAFRGEQRYPGPMRLVAKKLIGSRLAMLIATGALLVVAGCSKQGDAGASGSTGAASTEKTYSTKGTIKSFGPERKFASIAHENIPGYMAAMTMSFEGDTPARFEGLAAGDKVSFTFKVESGKHIVTAIKKEP